MKKKCAHCSRYPPGKMKKKILNAVLHFRWPIFISSGNNNDVRCRRINTSQFLISELLEAGVKRTGRRGEKTKRGTFSQILR